MATYLTFIGAMNLAGTAMLLGALNETFADGLLRRWTRIIPDDPPFRYAPHTRLWLWWAAIGTGFFGALNLVAAGWPSEYARVVVYGDIYAYASFELLAVAGTLSGRYGPGLWVTHPLWLAQAGWGIATLL